MRWTASSFDPCEWHLWFAWRPVRIDDKWVWLETVARRMHFGWVDWYEYGEKSMVEAQRRSGHTHGVGS